MYILSSRLSSLEERERERALLGHALFLLSLRQITSPIYTHKELSDGFSFARTMPRNKLSELFIVFIYADISIVD